MKTVWIVLAIVLGLGLLCCGGIFLTCNRVYNALVENNDAADRFAKTVIQDVGKDWNPDTLQRYASPEFTKETPPEQVKAYLAGLSKRLGPLKKVGEFTAVTTQANAINGESTVTVKTSTPTASFEKGTASVSLTVIKRNDKWSVVNLFVNPHD